MITNKMSYKDVSLWFARAKNPDAGRPVMSWSRMFKVGDTYELRHGSTTVGVFTPDNKFVFKLSDKQARQHSVTLSQALQRSIPFLWYRKSMGRYVVVPTPLYEEHGGDYVHMWDYFKDAEKYYVFDGLTFDLDTYLPTNRKIPVAEPEVDKTNKLVWLRSLKNFKHSVKVRAKIGVIDTLIHDVKQSRTGVYQYSWEMPNWESESWLDKLYESIRDNTCSTELLTGIIQSVPASYYTREVKVVQVLKQVDKICSNHSVALRTRFGVFKYEVPQVQGQDDMCGLKMG
jgi:hypothetical protein